MRLLRGLTGALLWILATVVGLVAVLLCATLLLLPVGIPLLGYARKLFTKGGRLMLPRALAHPVDELQRSTGRQGRRARKSAAKTTAKTSAKGKSAARSVTAPVARAGRKSRRG